MRAFRLTERRPRPGCHEIQVEGEIDLAVAGQLERALERAAAEHDLVLVGLEHCEFIDSTAIAVLVHAYNKMAAEGRRVAVYGPVSQVHRILSITGLTDNGLVFESLDEALVESS
jgi:anti-sigma B factor antagonist